MLLNVGPMGDGTVQQEAQDRIRAVGKWVKANAAAFYYVKKDPFDGACYEWMTASGTDPQTAYFQFIRSWNERRYLVGISNRVTRVWFVDTNEDLAFTQDPVTRIVAIKGHPFAPKEAMPRLAGVTFEGAPVPVYDTCWARCSPKLSGLYEKVAATRTNVVCDTWHGFSRVRFDFMGHAAWIVEPKVGPALGVPWTWTMQWADAFVDRQGCLDLLKRVWASRFSSYTAGRTRSCPPALNCELFANRFRAAGGDIRVTRRGLFGHHPHGVDPDKTDLVADFFFREKLQQH